MNYVRSPGKSSSLSVSGEDKKFHNMVTRWPFGPHFWKGRIRSCRRSSAKLEPRTTCSKNDSASTNSFSERSDLNKFSERRFRFRWRKKKTKRRRREAVKKNCLKKIPLKIYFEKLIVRANTVGIVLKIRLHVPLKQSVSNLL
jgi:hypothetical protein